MMKEKIRELLEATPFASFMIEMASGKSYQVLHPDFAIANAESAEVIVEEPNGLVHILNPMLITTILHEPKRESETV